MSNTSARFRSALGLLALGAAYFLAHRISYFFPDTEKILMAVWPAGGIGLAALLLSQRRSWPGILLVLFLAGNLANLLSGRDPLGSIGFMTANVLESFLCAWVIRKSCGEQVGFTRVRDILVLLAAATLVNACTAFVGALAAHYVFGGAFLEFYTTWWIVDGLGILLVTPMLVSYASAWNQRHANHWLKSLEAVLILFSCCLFTAASFGEAVGSNTKLVPPYMVIAWLAWAALRFGIRLTTTLMIAIAIIAIHCTEVNTNYFPLGGEDALHEMLRVQLYLSFASVVGMLLAASHSEQKTNASRLRESEDFLNRMLDSSPNAMWISDSHGTLIRSNQALCKSLHVRDEEIVGKYNILKDPIVESQGFMPQVRSVFEEGKEVRFSIRYDTAALSDLPLKEKSSAILNVSISPLLDDQGNVTHVVCQHVDITASVMAEERARENEKRYRLLFESMLDGFMHCKMLYSEGQPVDFVYLEVNKAFERQTEVGNLAGKKDSEVFPGAMQKEPELFSAYARVVRTGKPEKIELRLRPPVNVWLSIELYSPQPDHFVAIFEDTSERKRAEEALRLSEERFSGYFRANLLPSAISSAADNKIIELNDALLDLFGYTRDEMLGRNSIELDLWCLAEQREKLFSLLRQHGRVEQMEVQFRRKSGETGKALISVEYIEMRGQRLVFTVLLDITEREKAKEEKERLENQNRLLLKAESLGRMARAISHQLNNSLQGVILSLEMSMRRDHASYLHEENLSGAIKSAHQAAEIGSLMLTYLGLSHAKQAPIHLSAVCHKQLPALRGALPTNVTLVESFTTPGPVVIGNESQMQQILTNLATNAWESIGERQGLIRLDIRKVMPSEIPIAWRFPIDWQPNAQAYACLEVADNGCGIDNAAIENIFDPFYSSKFTGRGMGLAVALGIVRANDGVITVESTPGDGSIFRAFFPIAP